MWWKNNWTSAPMYLFRESRLEGKKNLIISKENQTEKQIKNLVYLPYIILFLNHSLKNKKNQTRLDNNNTLSFMSHIRV